MIRKSKSKLPPIPDLNEFTDEEGKKWVRTSADDLLSTKELAAILNTLEKQKTPDDIVLARIDFQKVNKEYYEAVIDLQARLGKQNSMLRKLLIDAKTVIDKKNNKLKELVEYIKRMHVFIAADNKISPEDIQRMMVVQAEERPLPAVERPPAPDVSEKKIIDYSQVEEIILDETGQETGKIMH